MKRGTKLFALLSGLILFAASCAQRTCPTYAELDNNTENTVEATV